MTPKSLEQVLQNINKLNRSLEGVIAVRKMRFLRFLCQSGSDFYKRSKDLIAKVRA